MERQHSKEIPHALQRMDEIRRRLAGKSVAVFLDYDGTLTPIVDRPEQARISDEMRALVERLAQRRPTAIVSGRSMKTLREFMKLDSVYYAGSHGLDIEGPPGSGVRYDVGKDFKGAVDAVYTALSEGVRGIKGSLVEHITYAVSVLYRMVASADVPLVEAVVDRALKEFPPLRKTHGKKIYEIRPTIDWDKGKAVLWILETLGLDSSEVLPIYVGDDVTDEDAFRALKGRGIGILVAETSRETAAIYRLNDPKEVGEFLERLIGLLENPSTNLI